MEKHAAYQSGARKSWRERRDVPKEKEKCSENIRAESEKSIVEQKGARTVVQNNAERGEDPIGEGRQTTAAKDTEL